VQGLDRYAYANNNPLRYIDPSGHYACSTKDCGYIHDYDEDRPAPEWLISSSLNFLNSQLGKNTPTSTTSPTSTSTPKPTKNPTLSAALTEVAETPSPLDYLKPTPTPLTVIKSGPTTTPTLEPINYSDLGRAIDEIAQTLNPGSLDAFTGTGYDWLTPIDQWADGFPPATNIPATVHTITGAVRVGAFVTNVILDQIYGGPYDIKPLIQGK
jgi:hypothetical protein